MWRTLAFALLQCLCLIPQATAQTIREISYAALAHEPHLRISFDSLPSRPEPGHILNAPLRFENVWIGERLAGQQTGAHILMDGQFDSLTGAPTLPLGVLAGNTGHNMVVAQHRGFGSNALFPIGPLGVLTRAGRGEGAVTLLFDNDIWALGLKIHADYHAPLGQTPAPGQVIVTFWDRQGQPLTPQHLTPDAGVQPHAWISDSPFAAVGIQTTDPGGIALDDILVPRQVLGF